MGNTLSSKGKREFARTMQAIFEGKFKNLELQQKKQNLGGIEFPKKKRLKTIFSSDHLKESAEYLQQKNLDLNKQVPQRQGVIIKKMASSAYSKKEQSQQSLIDTPRSPAEIINSVIWGKPEALEQQSKTGITDLKKELIMIRNQSMPAFDSMKTVTSIPTQRTLLSTKSSRFLAAYKNSGNKFQLKKVKLLRDFQTNDPALSPTQIQKAATQRFYGTERISMKQLAQMNKGPGGRRNSRKSQNLLIENLEEDQLSKQKSPSDKSFKSKDNQGFPIDVRIDNSDSGRCLSPQVNVQSLSPIREINKESFANESRGSATGAHLGIQEFSSLQPKLKVHNSSQKSKRKMSEMKRMRKFQSHRELIKSQKKATRNRADERDIRSDPSIRSAASKSRYSKMSKMESALSDEKQELEFRMREMKRLREMNLLAKLYAKPKKLDFSDNKKLVQSPPEHVQLQEQEQVESLDDLEPDQDDIEFKEKLDKINKIIDTEKMKSKGSDSQYNRGFFEEALQNDLRQRTWTERDLLSQARFGHEQEQMRIDFEFLVDGLCVQY